MEGWPSAVGMAARRVVAEKVVVARAVAEEGAAG